MIAERPKQFLFIALFLVSALPFVGSATALVVGALFAMILGNPFSVQSQKISKWMLKLAVIGLGFAVDFNQVIEVGRSSIVLTIVSITA
ncbi:MAG: putative sulfate exporter family transporter, partial [Pseudomonadota bacterium]|nr:putative sulfate exporter family transporter [Pseudomonadota bacterium]